ncbi:MAG: polyprenol monophosphomannose synthase [Acidimicrobiales bacterium]|nr:polyprenol monophosphomannose synthase [Acidimicrobiales bacterium]
MARGGRSYRCGVRSVVVVPTYQEAENIGPLLRAVRAQVPDTDIVVLDDDSPDGTGKLAEEIADELGRITVLHRAGKEGLGAAYREGFSWALARPYDVIVQMDCDLSHDPAELPALIGLVAAGEVDCAIGSRYVQGGSTPNWPLHRRMLSRYGNRYTAAVLALPVHDVTSGYRAYRSAALAAIHPETTSSNGYAFMSELALRLVAENGILQEHPITFVDRTHGASKMSVAIMVESLTRVTAWGLRLRLSRLQPILAGALRRRPA